MNKFASILIVSAKGYLLMSGKSHNSDNNSADEIVAFGGVVRGGEVPVKAAVRVLGEETGLDVRTDDLESLDVYSGTTDATDAEVYVYILAGVDEDRVHDYSGRGIQVVRRSDDFAAMKLSEAARRYVTDYFKTHKKY